MKCLLSLVILLFVFSAHSQDDQNIEKSTRWALTGTVSYDTKEFYSTANNGSLESDFWRIGIRAMRPKFEARLDLMGTVVDIEYRQKLFKELYILGDARVGNYIFFTDVAGEDFLSRQSRTLSQQYLTGVGYTFKIRDLQFNLEALGGYYGANSVAVATSLDDEANNATITNRFKLPYSLVLGGNFGMEWNIQNVFPGLNMLLEFQMLGNTNSEIRRSAETRTMDANGQISTSVNVSNESFTLITTETVYGLKYYF